jgi:hypothetical protein
MHPRMGLPAVPSNPVQAANEPKRISLLGIRSSRYAKAPLRRFGGVIQILRVCRRGRQPEAV